jgi:glycosyltransferase involved in cell wall biosynthesis
LLKRADAVICISETLRAEAISRGVDATKITVVHNAVSDHKGDVGGTPVTDESELLEQATDGLALSEGTVVVGYIGSLRAIEGVEQTVSAVAKLADQGLDVRFFALTSTSGQAELRRHCFEHGIADKSVITGPVPHQQVEPFYQLIDIFVVSRPKSRVTSLVTPLKPFEAMMAGRAVICSDLPALAEIVDDGKTGLLFSVDDADDLASTISRLAGDSDLRQRLGTAAKNWVESERTWEVVVERGLAAYVIAQAGNTLR